MSWESDLSKILRLRRLKLKFRSLNHLCEYGHIIENVISIDLATHRPPAKTFIHECLHYMYDKDAAGKDYPHSEIYEREKAIWDHITNKQIAQVYRKMFRMVEP